MRDLVGLETPSLRTEHANSHSLQPVHFRASIVMIL